MMYEHAGVETAGSNVKTFPCIMFPRTATHKEYKTTGRDRKKKDILEYYSIMGPPSYILSVVDRNVVMRCIPVFYEECYEPRHFIIAWDILPF